jgi:predicted ATP-grasp superfamily ATP-dependent carboligase
LAKRLRILLTEGSSLSARQALYPLGPYHDIDVLDPNPLCQCRFSSYVRRFIRSPSFAKQPVEFLRFVADAVRGGRYDVLLPTHEQTYLLSRFRDALTPHVGLALPEFASLERMQNKAEFSRLLVELDLPQPEMAIVRTRGDFDRAWRYPIYVKLAHSTAGGGVFYIENENALRERADRLEAEGLLRGETEILVQQPARGVLSSAQAVFNRGELIGVHCFESRRLGVGGMSTVRTSADHAIVREHVAGIGEHLAWHGAFFIDYFYDSAAQQPQYIEANPRIGETVNAMLAGINLPQLLVRISRGETPPRAPLGRFGVRTHNLLMILMSLAYEDAGRVALMRELRRFASRDDLYLNGEDELTRPRDDRLSVLPFVWATTQLLAWPGIARRIVAKTVDGYSLPETVTEQIKALPMNLLGPPCRDSPRRHDGHDGILGQDV